MKPVAPKLPTGKIRPRGLEKCRVDIPAETKKLLPLDRRIVRSEQRISGVRRRFGGFPDGIVRCFDLSCFVSGLLRTRHHRQSRLSQRKPAGPAGKPIKQGLRKEADVVRRREHTGVPGHSSHAPRRRVMDGAPKQTTKIGILARIRTALVVNGRRRDAWQQTGRR